MDNYSSLKELYLSLLPSFKVKLRLINRTKYNYLTEKDLWTYLQDNKWKNDNNLTIAMMTNDIINVKIDNVAKYMEENNEKK